MRRIAVVVGWTLVLAVVGGCEGTVEYSSPEQQEATRSGAESGAKLGLVMKPGADGRPVEPWRLRCLVTESP